MILQRLALRAALACALAALAPVAAHAGWVGRVRVYGTESGRVTANGEDFRAVG